MRELWAWLEAQPFAVAISSDATLFPVIETIHVIALTLVVGSIAVLDLRLLGIASRNSSVRELSEDVLPVTWISFAIAAIAGFLMFASNATNYSANFSFRLKILLLVGAGANMLMFNFFTYRTVSDWDCQFPPPTAARIAGGLSLALWVGIIACGRTVGFTM